MSRPIVGIAACVDNSISIFTCNNASAAQLPVHHPTRCAIVVSEHIRAGVKDIPAAPAWRALLQRWRYHQAKPTPGPTAPCNPTALLLWRCRQARAYWQPQMATRSMTCMQLACWDTAADTAASSCPVRLLGLLRGASKQARTVTHYGRHEWQLSDILQG